MYVMKCTHGYLSCELHGFERKHMACIQSIILGWQKETYEIMKCKKKCFEWL